MEQRHKDHIQTKLPELVDATDWSPGLETHLLAKNVCTEDMLQKIKRSGHRSKQELFLLATKRGPSAYSNLRHALVESGNLRAARILAAVEEGGAGSGDAEMTQTMANLNLGSSSHRVGSRVWNLPTYPDEQVQESAAHHFQPYIPPPVLADSTTPLNVVVKKATALRLGPNTYPMEAKPRGQVLIIDNEDFSDNVLNKRTGSLVDANNLDILFGELGFQVVLRRNLTFQEMVQEIQKFARKPEHSQADMAVVVVMSHGRHGLVAGKDGREIECEWLLRQFNNEGCPALKGKPKFFILQSCRGDEEDYGSLPRIEFPENSLEQDASKITPQDDIQDQQGASNSGPYKSSSWEDMLIAYATLPGYVANRDRYRGTWFIESLIQVFMDNAWHMDIRDMLDLVAQCLKRYESEYGTKQNCEYVVRHFYKKLYFNPGL